jgi:L-ascorbate metabolism protein UlaG (beta-lactamase superfamily)
MRLLFFLLFLTNFQALAGISFRWTGVSGFILDDGDKTLYFDPNLTMVRIWDWLPFQTVESNPKLVKYWTDKCELKKVDAIIINHSHTDHILDAPAILKKFGGEVFGSNSTLNYMRGMEINEKRLHEIDFNDSFSIGRFDIKVIKVVHPPHIFDFMLAKGKIEKPLKTPASPWDFKVGKTFSFYITHPEGTILFSSVATLPKQDPLQGLKADVLMVTIAKRGETKNFVQKRILPVQAKKVIALHYDDFFNPLNKSGKPKALPFVDPDEFYRTTKKILGENILLRPNYCEKIDLF